MCNDGNFLAENLFILLMGVAVFGGAGGQWNRLWVCGNVALEQGLSGGCFLIDCGAVTLTEIWASTRWYQTEAVISTRVQPGTQQESY